MDKAPIFGTVLRKQQPAEQDATGSIEITTLELEFEHKIVPFLAKAKLFAR
jgi:hypothetical protein